MEAHYQIFIERENSWSPPPGIFPKSNFRHSASYYWLTCLKRCSKLLTTDNRSLPLIQKLATCNVVTLIWEIMQTQHIHIWTLTGLIAGWSFANLSFQSAVTKGIKEDCFMTKKKLVHVPADSLSDANINYKDHFLDQIVQLDCTTLHFFNESGVKITSGYCVHSNSRDANLWRS